MGTCRLCGADLEGRADKQFCNEAHKQAYWRRKQKEDQADALDAELKELRAKVQDQAQYIEELEQKNMRLLAKLEIKQRLHEDHERRGFIAWLKKQPAAHIGELGQRIRNDERMPSMGSRAIYAAHVRSRYSKDDIDELNNLWELMLLQS